MVLVSRVPLEAFSGPRFEANLQEIVWIEPRVRAHAEVIARTFACQPVLPLRFGTLFSTTESLAAAMSRRETELLAELASIEGQEEWTVRVCANPEALAEQRAKEEIARATSGGRGAQYLLQRRIAVQGRHKVMGRVMALAEDSHAALAALALDVTPARSEVSGIRGSNRSLISRIYRIDQACRHDFLSAVDLAGERLAAEGLVVVLSGPWPPARPDLLAESPY